MIARKTISTFCLCSVFWLLAGWGLAWRDRAKTRAEYAEAGMAAAGLLVMLGFILLKIGTKAWDGHEAPREAKRFALIVIATGIACGLVAFGILLLDY